MRAVSETLSQKSLMWVIKHVLNTCNVLNILLGLVRDPEEAQDLSSPPLSPSLQNEETHMCQRGPHGIHWGMWTVGNRIDGGKVVLGKISPFFPFALSPHCVPSVHVGSTSAALITLPFSLWASLHLLMDQMPSILCL